MMRPSLWLLCFCLVLTRLLGLHVHACAGIEGTPHQHEPAHYADSGLLFGEFHAGDHADNLELNLVAAIPAIKLTLDGSDGLVLPTMDRTFVPAIAGWMTIRVPRGPPAGPETRPAYFVPPLRGPPSHSLA